MTKRIIQTDTWSCFACVAAMITGETTEDVFKFVGHDGSIYSEESTHPQKCRGFGYVDIIKYLIEKRYTIGTWADFGNADDISNYDEIHFDIPTSGEPAILEVESKLLGSGCTHVIYWDGENIFDPSPGANENPGFSNYMVLKWIPVIHFE